MATYHTISHADKVYKGNAKSGYSPDGRRGVEMSHLLFVDLGAPANSDTDAIMDGWVVATDATTTVTAGGMLLATLTPARNIIIDSSDSTEVDSVVTITGTNINGEVMVEQLTANGTTAVNGKKAFKTLTSISAAATTTAGNIDIGFGNVFGLPVRVDYANHIFGTKADNTDEAWTFVAADVTQDATAGDARGTVVPGTTPNGTIRFSCCVYVADTSTKAAAFGYDEYTG